MGTVTTLPSMLCCFLLVVSSNSALLAATKPDPEPMIPAKVVHVATDLWPGFTEPDGEGAYLHLLRVIFPADTRLELHFTSFSRSILMAEQQHADMVIGIAATDSQQLLYSNYPFDVDEIAVLYLAGQPVLDTASSLATLRLATQRGYNYELVLNIDNTSYEVDSIRTGVEMVRNQRVDAFLVEKTELRSKLTGEDLTGLELRFLKGEPIFMGFSNSASGLALKQWWDDHYSKLYHNGQLELLYQQYPNFILPELAPTKSTPASATQ
ncbi:transporter substrate-binding domain-containing protein [Alkalimonas sp. MEB108]|uniref:Transporter substrate-binding domain-containing protein n=1 Tax=Alkalimonas cellulosilytica TaxID=3058395 RepID=A0ABU7J491_9GAMM|nr:transporter substrate-binding domain-containing protein [Alkalimonas sp. MEB108]MEE2001173.1 transporter substrate-binding domain-containing protein [Alkalimonas sp. MEB108]